MRFVLALCLVAATASAEPTREDIMKNVPTTSHEPALKDVPQHETLSDRPSGFWTSNRPVEAGKEYRWTLLYIGIGVALITGVLTVRLIKTARGPRRQTMP